MANPLKRAEPEAQCRSLSQAGRINSTLGPGLGTQSLHPLGALSWRHCQIPLPFLVGTVSQNLAGCISKLKHGTKAAKLYKEQPSQAGAQGSHPEVPTGRWVHRGATERHASDRTRLTCRTDVQTEKESRPTVWAVCQHCPRPNPGQMQGKGAGREAGGIEKTRDS